MRLSARSWPGRGRHVVLVHGLASTQHIWDLTAGYLSPLLRVVTYDQRGHGTSSKPSTGYGFDEVCRDLGAVLRAVGARRPVLVGHSYGANVALQYTAEHPGAVAGIVCVDGGFGSLSDRMNWSSARAMLAPPKLAGMRIEALVAMARAGPLGSMWSDEIERVVRSLFEVDARGRARPRLARANHMRILRAMYGQRPLEQYARLGCPALVIAARPSDLRGPEAGFYEMKKAAGAAVRRSSPRLTWRWVRSIHDVPLHMPRRLADLIARFAASL